MKPVWYLVVTQARGHPACEQEEFVERHELKAGQEPAARIEASMKWRGLRSNTFTSNRGVCYPINPRLVKEISLRLDP